MVLSNYERVGKAVQLLAEGLAPFVDRECRAEFGDDWPVVVQRGSGGGTPRKVNPVDAQFLLKVIWAEWRTIFSKKLSRIDRNYVSELQGVRNDWAHNNTFSTDDTLRALDTAQRLLESAAAGAQANEVGKLHQDLLRQKFEQMPGARRKAAPVQPDPDLPARREEVTRHDDVTTGESPADLHRVRRSKRPESTATPTDSFRQTFLVQVNPNGYNTIIQNRSYSNVHWERKARGDKSERWKNRYNRDHGMVKSGDLLVLYYTSTVPNETYKGRLACSVIVSSVSDDSATFKIGELQYFQNLLKLIDIRKYVKQGKLDDVFNHCGKQGFNITKLEPTVVKQLFELLEPQPQIPSPGPKPRITPPPRSNEEEQPSPKPNDTPLVEPQIPPCQARQQTALRRVWRAVLAAVRRLRRRFQRRDRGGGA